MTQSTARCWCNCTRSQHATRRRAEASRRVPLKAHQAQAAGLLDGVLYEDELPAFLGTTSQNQCRSSPGIRSGENWFAHTLAQSARHRRHLAGRCNRLRPQSPAATPRAPSRAAAQRAGRFRHAGPAAPRGCPESSPGSHRPARRFARRLSTGFGPDLARGPALAAHQAGRRLHGQPGSFGRILCLCSGQRHRRPAHHPDRLYRNLGWQVCHCGS